MSESKKQKADLRHLSKFDAAALVANTALVARDSGHPFVVRHARVQGEQGIIIFIPGFELVDGELRLVANEPLAETAVKEPTP